MSDSVRPQRRQPIRLPRPWDSPGKNTGVGCHFLLQCMKVKTESKSLSCVRLLATPWTAAYQAPPSMGFSRQEFWSGVPLPSLYMILLCCFYWIHKVLLCNKFANPMDSLVAQWLGRLTPNTEGPGSVPGQGTRSHMSQLRVCAPQLRVHVPQLKTQDPACLSQDLVQSNK